MSAPAIRVHDVSKRYRIGVRETRPDTLAAATWSWMASPLANYRRLRALSRFDDRESAPDVIWALKDVSMHIEQGQVVGIVGRNGAGKSTLLKILSRITEPTTGRVVLNGRVASILEIGTGFHPELTGRENVYLNGTVLGMRKLEIDRKFDEIVDYAGVKEFIDTPVKRYSSGMKIRLAFAVAAHLEAEILLIDEVLAVGDAEFQRKCLGKMDHVARSGRTVLFVSHNMQAVQRLCDTAYFLEKGRVVTRGSPQAVIATYMKTEAHGGISETVRIAPCISLSHVRVLQDGKEIPEHLDNKKPVDVEIAYRIHERAENLLLGFDLYSAGGVQLFRTYDLLTYGLGERGVGDYVSTCRLPENLLQPGTYFADLVVGLHRRGWLSKGDIRVRMNFGGLATTDVKFNGALLPMGRWTVSRPQDAACAR